DQDQAEGTFVGGEQAVARQRDAVRPMEAAEVDRKELLHRGDVEDGDGVAAEAVLGHPEDAVVADVEAASVGGERGFMREAADLYTPEFPDIFAVKRDGAGDLLDDREVRLLLRRGDGAGSEQDPDAAETGACHATEGHYPPKNTKRLRPGGETEPL